MISARISDQMIKGYQSPLFDDPADYGLDYDDVSFETADGVTLRGWLIHGDSDRVILQVHFGVQCCRSGYTREGKTGPVKLWKQDIPFLRHVKYLNDRGYSVLMYDTRSHGESDPGPNPWTSWGYMESPDVVAAIDYLGSHPTYDQANVGILGICMGAAETTYAYGVDGGLRNRDSIKAFVAIQPILYKDMVSGFGIPGVLERRTTRVTNERLGMSIRERTFLPDVSSIDVPTRVVQNTNDPWHNAEFVQSYYDALEVDKDIMWLDIEKGRAAAYDYLGREPEQILDWFDRHV